MIHVVFDTSIYRGKPRLDSPEFKALGYLAKNGCACIHVPYIVKHEFESYLYHEHVKKIDKTISSLSGLIAHKKANGLVPELSQSLETIKENKEELYEETKEEFSEWLDSVGAITYDFSDTEAQDALNAYFYGKAPLKQPKNKNDIPDSFIYQSVKSLHGKYGDSLHFVVNDGNLRSACNADGVIAYEALSDFIAIDEAKACLKNALIEENKGTVFQHLLQFSQANADKILDQIETLLLGDEYRLISGDSVPGESNEIYVSSVDKPHSLNIVDSVEHYGEGLFVLYFTAVVEFIYEFAVYRSEAFDLDRKKYYLEYLNGHYFNVETTDEFRFTGRLELEYGGDFGVITTRDDLLKALQHPEITISELDDFEINA
jgi:hypothetical protein